MTPSPRTIRRAAERQALKAARKEQKSQPTQTAPGAPTASPAQFAANRANAQLSHGPSSPEGKAISSRNHTVHGLTVSLGAAPFKVLSNEDQSVYDNFLASLKNEWQPATASELNLVESLASHTWLRRRASGLQDEMLERGLTEPQHYKQFEVYARYHNTHMRAANKALADLMRLRNFQMRQLKDEAMLQRRAQDAQIRFESQKRKSEEHAARMETFRLKQEAQKQRNQRRKVTESVVPSVTETIITATAEPRT